MRPSTAAAAVRAQSRLSNLWLLAAVFVLVGCLLAAPQVLHAQALGNPIVMGAAPAKAASAASGTRSAKAPPSPRPTSPLWTELTPPQQQALAPLAAAWPTINEGQKRKWLVMSQSYGRLSAAEQGKLHGRMSEWVTLSPQQRAQARLNFAETKQLSPDDKKAKWEAYQALPPEEKRKLVAGAASAAKPPGTAAAVKPVPSQKMTTLRGVGDSKPPRIAAAPNQIDQNTLLPQPAQPVTVSPTN